MLINPDFIKKHKILASEYTEEESVVISSISYNLLCFVYIALNLMK